MVLHALRRFRPTVFASSVVLPRMLSEQVVPRLIKQYRDVSLQSPFLLLSGRKTKKEMLASLTEGLARLVESSGVICSEIV